MKPGPIYFCLFSLAAMAFMCGYAVHKDRPVGALIAGAFSLAFGVGIGMAYHDNWRTLERTRIIALGDSWP